MQLKERNFLLLILLSVVTCGIYQIIFWWGMINDLNTLTKDGVDEVAPYWKAILLTLITCGIYSFVWYYKIGENQRLNGDKYNVDISEGGSFHLIMLALAFLGGITPIISSYVMIKNHNTLVEAYNSNLNTVID